MTEPGQRDVDPGSLFEQFMGEVVDPLKLTVGGRTVRVEVPDADAVCELDDLTHPADIVAALTGDDDELLDALEVMAWSATLEVCAALREHFALEVLPRGAWTRIVEQIDLYGEAVEADLADRGHDLLDWFRGRRSWRQLLRLLARLPPESRYMAALLDDETLARERIDAEDDTARDTSDDDEKGSSTRPPLVGESADRALRRATVSALMRIEHAVYASQAPKGKGGHPPKPLRGPETAEDRIREQRADRDVEDIFDQIAPGWRVAPPPEQVGRDPAPDPPGFAESGSGLWVPEST